MKQRIVVIFITILLASCNQVASPTTTVSALRTPTSPTQKPTMTPTPTPPLPTNTTEPGEQGYMIADLNMVDHPYGWAVFAFDIWNDDGQYWLGRTVDGGHTWVNVTPPAYKTIRDGWLRVSALDSETAWAYSTGNYHFMLYEFPTTIWRTEDGGRSWQTLPTLPDCHHWRGGCVPARIQFVDELHGWIEIIDFGRNYLGYRYYKTVDGETWERLPEFDLGDGPANSIFYLTFFDREFGLKYPTWTEWLSIDEIEAGHFKWIERTLDGGNSWQPALFPRPEGFAEVVSVQGLVETEKVPIDYSFEMFSREPVVVGFRVNFLTEKNGPSFFEICYVSADRGQNWQQLSSSGEAFFVDPASGWRIADANPITLERTVDGGNSWQLYPQDAWKLEFDHGIKRFVHITDGGTTRTEIEPLFLEEELWPGRGLRLESLRMQSKEEGWGVEAGGTSVCTSDGARTWQVCRAPEEPLIPAEAELQDTEGIWSPDEPLPNELFHGGEVPARLQALMDDSRQFEQFVDVRDRGQAWDPFRFSCSSQRVDTFEGDALGVARRCVIHYPLDYDLTYGFETGYWLYDYYVLIAVGESRVWSNVISADFVDARVGKRLLDLQNGFFRLEGTVDGGDTWTTIKIVSWWTDNFEFVSELEGFCIARVPPLRGVPYYQFVADLYREAVLMHTVDGGATWEEMQPVMGP